MASKQQQDVKPEGDEPYKQYVIILEKKIRNLEKRKVKLDDYKHKQQTGTELNDDQKQAISHYSEVSALLETLNDLHKSYISINNEICRNNKKQLKKFKLDKENDQNFIISFILKLYYLLSAIQIPKFKNEIMNNKKIAFKSEDFDVLDKFYHSIFDFEHVKSSHSFSEYISMANENLFGIFNMKHKVFDETTYTFNQIKTLLENVDSLDIFKSINFTAESKPEDADNEEKIEDDKLKSLSEDSSSEETDAVLIEKPPKDLFQQNVNLNCLPPLITDPIQLKRFEQYINSHEANQFNKFGDKVPSTPRALNDLLASFQSSFNFVQDSMIESGQTYF